MTPDRHARPRLDDARAAAIRDLLTDTVSGEPARAAARRRRRIASAVAASAVVAIASAATVLALAGGGNGPRDDQAAPGLDPTSRPGTSSSPTAPASLSPVGTPTPEPAPTPERPRYDPSVPATWTFAPDSVGPVSLGGSTLSQIDALTAFDRWADDGSTCPAVFFSRPDGLSLVVASDGLSDATVYAVVSAPVALGADALRSISPTTVRGVGLGSDSTEVRAAYPDAVRTLDADPNYGTQYAVAGPDGQRLVFVLGPEDLVTSVAIGTTDIAPPEYCG